MKTFNIGIIGYGGFGQFLHNAWNQLEQVRIVAVADTHLTTKQAVGSFRVFSDWKTLIHEMDIDLIAIVTQPATHEAIAIACMEAGKNVLIEKPLATSVQGAENIIRARNRTGMVAGIDFMLRFNPLLQALQSLTQQGVFGKLRRIDVENYAQDEQLPLEHWFWEPKLSGGILIEHAVHFIDLVHFLSPAKVVAVNGLKHNRNPHQEDQVMANVLYEDGMIATHYHSFSRPGFFEVTKIKLAFDLADMELHGWIPLHADVKILVNSITKDILLAQPLFQINNSVPVAQSDDDSRPAGWGMTEVAPKVKNQVRCSGIFYEVDEVVTGTFQIGKSKQAVYTGCVSDMLLDVLKKIEYPEHQLIAPLETGLSSLEVAVQATQSARNADNTVV